MQVLVVQLPESPPLQEVAREAGEAGRAEVVSGAGEEVQVRFTAMCAQVHKV